MSAAIMFRKNFLVRLVAVSILAIGAVPGLAAAQTIPSVSIDDVSVVEGNSGTVVARFTLRLSAPSTQAVSVRIASADGSATAGSDYVARSGTNTFAPGETVKTQPFTINGDTDFEADETFFVNLSNPVGLTIAKAQGVATILNDDVAADTTPDQFGFASVTDVALGSVQTSNPITVAGINAASPISVVGGSYSVNGGAFVTTSGTVTVGQTVRVQQTASNTAGATTVATLTIGGVSANYSVTTALPSVSIADASISEGNSGTTNLSFTVSLSSAASSVVTVPYTTADGTATTADNDYVAGSGTVSFPAGSTSQTLNVSINGDTKFESDETFVVNLGAPSGAALGRGQAVGTIVNDDTSTPTLSIADASTQEGNAGTKNLPFTVTLSPASTTTVTVKATTSNGTATSGSDYNGGTLTITFAPGETTKTGNVGIRGDTDSEPDETFFVTLNTPTGGAVLGRSQATGTILNDDVAADTTPDQFGFASVTDVALGSVQTSNPITVAGINAASPISVVGGSYSVNGGAFVTTSGTVTVGQTVRVQQTASNTAGATTVATLTIGGVSANYSVTT
ncbi:Calx-beta domain-containing protein, partial [Nevskia ramosa]|uniref:Calx-beta domain-containing protein n=1 Tax=Nevskia ramosa TaxID=64002 RepID=UPI0023564E75